MELILLMMQKISASVLAIRFGKIHFTILEPLADIIQFIDLRKGTPFVKAIQTSPSSVIPLLSNKTNKIIADKIPLPIHLL